MCKLCQGKQLVNSNREGANQIADELAMKLKLEEPFTADLKRLFKQMLEDYYLLYGTTGMMFSIAPYSDEMTAILKKHYRKTSDKFAFNITSELEFNEQVKKVQDTTQLAINKEINNLSKVEAGLINTTTYDEISNITKRVITNSALQGEQLTNEEIANDVYDIYNPQIQSRAESISMTEINTMAEKSKFTEADIINSSVLVIGGISVANKLDKIWNSTLDSKTRPAHAKADGQRVPISSTFNVGNESLRYPGDERASVGNRINCRCGLTYRINT